MPSSLLLVVGLLTAALSLVVLPAGSVAAAPARAAAAAPDPGDDYFRMPAACPQPGKIIPQRPVGCRLTAFNKNRPTVMVWGDSHAWQHLPALLPLARAYHVNLTAFVLGGCPPVQWPYKGSGHKNYLDSRGRLRNCHYSNAMALHYAKTLTRRSQPLLVVLGSHWAGFRSHYQRIFVEGQTPICDEAKPYVLEMSKLAHMRSNKLFSNLRRNSIQTVATSQTATVPHLRGPGCPEREDPFTGKVRRKASIVQEGRTRTWLLNRMRGIPGSPDLVDVNGAVCGPKWCRGMKNGIHTWYDDLHISRTRMRTLIPRWQHLFANLRS